MYANPGLPPRAIKLRTVGALICDAVYFVNMMAKILYANVK